MTDHSLEAKAMTEAIRLARQALHTTRENPRVGAVLIADGKILAAGWHQAPGHPHAEINALQALPDLALAKGATCVVTLEPCNHQGRTGPCTRALIDAGVARVVMAMEDPNPQVRGQGRQALLDAGIDVEVGLLADQAAQLNPGFIRRMTVGLPWITLKSAASLDGKTAMADGESQWITGPESRADVQLERARAGAIVTGIGTLLADNPRLTVRYADIGLDPAPLPENQHQPIRVVVDSRARLPEQTVLTDCPGAVLWVTAVPVAAHALLESGRVTHWCLPDPTGKVDLREMCLRLAELGINEVFVEAGEHLAGGFIEAGLVDRGLLYLAPKLLGRGARSLYDIAPPDLAAAPQVVITEIRQSGDDLRLEWQLKRD